MNTGTPTSWTSLVTPTEERTLESGLRVVLVHRPCMEFAVVLTQTRGGSRADPVGAAGTAHLTEHLLSQVDGREGEPLSRALVAAGADLSATTHPGYMEFRAEVPYGVLPLALRAERARLTAWPELRNGVFERQREGVRREIENHYGKRHTRNLPWPALGPLIFDNWADSHDPFGDTDHVRHLTEADCRRFFELHHTPARTVLVVMADVTRICGGTGGVFATLEGLTQSLSGPPPVIDRSHTRASGIHTLDAWEAPHSVGSIGWRVPSVAEDPQTYAALLAVGAQLGQHPGARARLGQMSPMDRQVGDVLTVTIHDFRDARPALRRVSSESLHTILTEPDEVQEAMYRARTSIAATLDRPCAAAQLVGRAVTLSDDAHAAASWVEAVRTVNSADVIAAARQLLDTQGVGAIGVPRAPAPPKPTAATKTRCIESAPQTSARVERPVRERTVRMVVTDQNSLTAALIARLRPSIDVGDVRRLRARGYRLTSDGAGWLMELHEYGSAAELASKARNDLNFSDRDEGGHVQHVALCGPYATRAAQWVVKDTVSTNDESHEQHGRSTPLKIYTCEVLPHGIAAAELCWPLDAGGFIERWAGVALLMGIYSRDAEGQVNPLDAPSDMFIGIKQRLTAQGPELVADIAAPPGRLSAALQHAAVELTFPRLEERGKHVKEVVETLTAGWQRDLSAPLSLVRRASVVLDLGGADDDIHAFVPKLYATSAGAIIERISRDTEKAPHAAITTSDPEELRRNGLPWHLDPGNSGDSCHES